MTSDPSVAVPGPAVSKPRATTLWALLVASTLTVMAAATIAPSLPQIDQVFVDTPNHELLTRLVLTITAIFIVLGSPLAGSIVDRFGRKPLLLIGLVLYALAGTSGLYLDSLYALLVGRAVLGLSVACIMTSATTLIADMYQGSEKSQALGRQSAFMGAGGVAFLLIGGALADIGWRLPFAIYFTSLAVFAMVWLFVPETDHAQRSQVGAAKAQWPVALVGLVMVLVMVSQIAFYLWPVQLPFFLAERFDLGGGPAGLAIAMASGTGALVSVLYRHVRARLSDLAIVCLVYALMGGANLILSAAPSYPVALMALIMGGAGIGLIFPTASNWLTNVVPPELRGRAVGLASTAIFSGHFLSPFVSQPVMQMVGYGPGYALFGVVLLGLALAVGVGALATGWRAQS